MMDEHVRIELSRILQEYADASGVFITAMRMNWMGLGRNHNGDERQTLHNVEFDAYYLARDPKRRSDPGGGAVIVIWGLLAIASLFLCGGVLMVMWHWRDHQINRRDHQINRLQARIAMIEHVIDHQIQPRIEHIPLQDPLQDASERNS